MNNDLISREALKAELGNLIPNISNVMDMIIFIKLIEHAPTVNPCENCDLYFKATTKEIDRWYKKEEREGGAENDK